MPKSLTSWPAESRPDGAPVYTFNEIEIAAPAERVWAWLVCAPRWPEYYENASKIRFVDGGGPDLALGTRFTWTTFNVNVDSTVTECVAPARLAWQGKTVGG